MLPFASPTGDQDFLSLVAESDAIYDCKGTYRKDYFFAGAPESMIGYCPKKKRKKKKRQPKPG